jgi:hypothetical protein
LDASGSAPSLEQDASIIRAGEKAGIKFAEATAGKGERRVNSVGVDATPHLDAKPLEN